MNILQSDSQYLGVIEIVYNNKMINNGIIVPEESKSRRLVCKIFDEL